ncbi:carbohydrate ABC transporter permease [Kribbella shirazensis]|uniref:ABC-type glycerol-3-phosphate transport system permease component n=1 Tax=Kribbella shirazensis TaxID=1105143 RepID=A0A7X6A669_9ACTN|nr:carbohydrate ABC transporter permease [Kribbella shirazensis]NIK62029.1 ABC-type glycerol-3-phosphate transport system permease component [Kribbella shirazensis]
MTTYTARPVLRRQAALGGKHLILLGLSVLMLFPLVLILSTALKTDEDVRSNPFGLFSSVSSDNLVTAWTVGNFGDYVLNSFLLSVPSTVIVVVLSTLGGYAFARLPFPGRSLAFYLVVLGLLVPFFTYMIPLYFQLRGMGLLNTLLGANLVLASTGLSFGTFFIRAFFTDLPTEIEEAARIDGASEWQIFVRVMLPLVTSGAGALAVFTFLQNWNNFLVPLLYLPSGSYRPLTTGLYLFLGGRSVDIGPLAAGALITILPVMVLFVVMQRQVTQGFLSGAVKG